jgi:hypothetical protein
MLAAMIKAFGEPAEVLELVDVPEIGPASRFLFEIQQHRTDDKNPC